MTGVKDFGLEKSAERGEEAREERRRREQHGMVVRVDPGVSSHFGPIARANWAGESAGGGGAGGARR